VPSAWEWETVLQIFASIVGQELTSDGDFHKFDSDSNRIKFQNSFKLPSAGNIGYVYASLIGPGGQGHYWSSSPKGSVARSLRFYSSNVNGGYGYDRANGKSIRCFKDHPDAPATRTITFHENG
jgi:hypothetical protein